MPVVGIHDTQPAHAWEDAFLSGNGEVGIMVFGPPGRERVVHNHHRFVLPNASRTMGPPATADRVDDVRDLILAGRRVEAQRLFSDGRGLAWTQAFHPGHVLHLDVFESESGSEAGDGVGPADGVGRGYRRETRFTTGEVITSWRSGTTTARHRAFVSRSDGVVVHEVSGVDVALCLSADTPGLPDDVAVATSALVTECGEGVLTVVADYPPVAGEDPDGGGPEGFAGVTRVVADGGTVDMSGDVGGDVVRVRGARRVLILTRVDRWRGRARPRRARTRLAALPADYETLLSRHVVEHGRLFGRCTLDLTGEGQPRVVPVAPLRSPRPDDTVDPELVEALFASGRYLLLSACGVLPPRLTGLWLGAWGAAWSGDFTTDANLNLQLAGVTTTGMPELLAGYVALLAGQVDDWRLNARRVYGARGFLAPSRTDGEHGRLFHVDDDWPWSMWLAGADWLLLPLVEYWQASGDDAVLGFLAGWLAEVATFFEDVLTRTDADGRLMLVPSYSPEVGPCGGEGVAAVNATMDVAAARHALTVAADVVERLGADAPVRLGADAPVRLGADAPVRLGADGEAVRRWRGLAERLPEYRVDARGALAEWAWPGVRTPDSHRHVSHLYPVWPLHEITPDDTPGLAAAARAALVRRGDENLSAHGSLHRALVAARLKDADLVRANLLKLLQRRMVHRSLMTSHNPDLEIYNADAALCLPAVVVEMLLDSRPGVVELLPALPGEWRRGRLRGSPTRAGVVVDDLSWDAGWVRAVLRSPDAREIAVVCRRAADGECVRRRVRLEPMRPQVVEIRTVTRR